LPHHNKTIPPTVLPGLFDPPFGLEEIHRFIYIKNYRNSDADIPDYSKMEASVS